ncbi:MAG: NUDIX hydrolase [Rhodanobacteraceae bacterium]|nr:NUDIX hydrolase [Rhodanobacteraceae bacterium]
MTLQTPNPGVDEDLVWRPRVTVATIVPKDDRYLLVEEDIRGRMLLNQPAGHLEPGESLAAAARRETREETGWDIELECLVAIHQWVNAELDRHFLRFTFAARPLRRYAEQPLDAGIRAALWMSRTEIAAATSRLRSPLILASIDAWLGGQRLPLDSLQYLVPGPERA